MLGPFPDLNYYLPERHAQLALVQPETVLDERFSHGSARSVILGNCHNDHDYPEDGLYCSHLSLNQQLELR